jgi:PAS domain-containing protein
MKKASDGAMEGIYWISLRGKNMVANPALAKMLGYDSAEETVRDADEIMKTPRQEVQLRWGRMAWPCADSSV